MIAIKTRAGFITSYREAWRNWAERPVWTWRCDKDVEPHDFVTVEAAQEWIYQIWHGSIRKERAEAGWQVMVWTVESGWTTIAKLAA